MQVTSTACSFSKFVSWFRDCCFLSVWWNSLLKYQEVPSPLMVTFVCSDVLMAMTVKITVSCNVVPCRLVVEYVSEEFAVSIFRAQNLYKCTKMTSVPRQQCSAFWLLLLKSKDWKWLFSWEEMISFIYVSFFIHFLCDLNSLARHVYAFRLINWNVHYTFYGRGSVARVHSILLHSAI